MQFSDLDLNKTYSYADYLKWEFDERLELIKGKIFKMTPAPSSFHQVVSRNITGVLWSFQRKALSGIFCSIGCSLNAD